MPDSRLPIDTILVTGRVRTLDAADTVAEAVAVAGDRVHSVGRAADLLAAAPAGARIIEMDGATLIPGFNDAHAHMEREGLKRIRPSLADCRSIADIVALIRGIAAKTPPGEWIVTMPLGEPPYFFDGVARLEDKRPPDRADLDAATTEHPVCIPGLFGNWGTPPGTTCLNSRALTANGITGDTRPRVGGIEILTDATGEPTGIIMEHNPRPMVEFDVLGAVPAFTREERMRGLVRSMQLYNGVGTTSVYEGHGSAPAVVGLYRDLWERGELTVRAGLVLSPVWADVAEAAAAMRDWLAYARGAGLGDPWLRISGIHLAFGGDPCMAALSRDALPNCGWSGFVEQANDPATFEAICHLCAEHDIRLNTIVSDQLRAVVEILERVSAKRPIAGKRWVIQHIGQTDRATLERLARLDVLVTTIPVYFVWKGGHRYDPARGDGLTPMKTLLDLGIEAASATDNIPYNPGFTLWSMCARSRRSDGVVLGPSERLTRHQALRSLTVAGAPLTFEEAVKGPLTPGRYADLAILDIDPLTADDAALQSLSSRLTMVGGRIVHEAI
ncbi:amidohydrolase [Acuticoccus kandeliae]|uniref:amidohydrolase n=1 Tax=Acuticoccus kandeliae TaxID=2073160 RepID=UPI00196B21F5|nr:amidohydrolase family protein [Acuticoccus kandeliae]